MTKVACLFADSRHPRLRIVWLAGQTGGNTGDFETQDRQVFHQIDLTLKRAGGSLADMVTMTVFIKDPWNGDRLTELRREIFLDGRSPGSAPIPVSNFAVSAASSLSWNFPTEPSAGGILKL